MSLTLLILLPLAGSGIVALLRGTAARVTALAVALAELGLVAAVASTWLGAPAVPLTEHIRVFSAPAIWALRLDGLSVPLVALTAVLGVVSLLASANVKRSPHALFALLLALQSAVTAVFLAESFVLFYVAWEAVLIPMFFIIGLWGHERRRHAAMKFFLYTFLGSVLMLVALIVVMARTGATWLAPGIDAALGAGASTLAFWLLAAGVLVKVPVVPIHTWLPDAHVEAPTAGSIMLAGVLLKMGGYGLLRLGPMFPEAYRDAAPVLAALGIAGIAYGSAMALAQRDLKRLIAYSSVGHMGFVVLAAAVATPLALGAAMLVMVSHGFVSGLLFLLAGQLYDRARTREIARFGGLAAVAPGWAVAFTFAALASLGLPGLSGFPGELLSVLEAAPVIGWWLALVAVGLVLSAAYNLWAVARINHGPVAREFGEMGDLTPLDWAAVAPLAAGVVVLGVWPGLLLGVTDAATTAVARMLGVGA